MIQKLNNISFKGIYPLYSITSIDANDYAKLIPVINMENEFPQNDIFLGCTPKNKLIIEVREKDNTKELLCEEALNKTNMSTEEFIGFVKFIQKLRNAYRENHPETIYKTSTEKTLNQMSMFDIAWAINNAVQAFNEKFGNKPN